MLIDRLNLHGFDFYGLPDHVKKDIDLLTDLRQKTGDTSNQKLGVLDLALFETIEQLQPENKIVHTVRSEYEFHLQEDSNNSFNSKGLVELDKGEFQAVVKGQEVSNDGDPEMMKGGGNIEKKKTIADLKSIYPTELVNAGNYKVGYRAEWLDTPILLGRERDIILPNGEVHDALFAIVELDDIIASHNEKTFSSSELYPVTKDGRNVNDRNYETDENAKLKVQSTAQQLQPDLIISTGVDSEGTPIVSIDGIVISGNNRTMSLKLAKSDFPDRFADYVRTLEHELEQGGYGLYGIDAKEMKEKGFKHPVLVRIDTDFQSYLTEELNKFNVDSKKSERPLDQAIRIAQQLEDNQNCKDALINLVSGYDMPSELRNHPEGVRSYRKILLDCGLINNNQIAQLFTQTGFTDAGNVLYLTILSSLILYPKTLQISQNDGVKRSTKSLTNAIIPAIKNEQFKIGSLTDSINRAILLQSKAVGAEMTVAQFISEPEMFGEDVPMDLSSSVIAVYLSKGGNAFKQKLLTYNASMEQNQTAGMFGDPMSPEEVFYKTFVENLSFVEKILILRRFNDYLASLEIALEDYKKAKSTAQGKNADEIEKSINSLVELRNFAI